MSDNKRSFLSGIARLFNPFSLNNHKRLSDKANMHKDWERIGRDIRKAIKEYEEGLGLGERDGER